MSIDVLVVVLVLFFTTTDADIRWAPARRDQKTFAVAERPDLDVAPPAGIFARHPGGNCGQYLCDRDTRLLNTTQGGIPCFGWEL